MAIQGLCQPSYYLCKSALKSSVVLQAIYGHIRSRNSEDLVFGKETAIELLVVGKDGTLQSVCEQSVFGTIKDMKLLPWNSTFRASSSQVQGKDLLAVLSDSGKLSFITFNVEAHRFLAVAHVHVSAPGFSSRELGCQLVVEPTGRAVAVASWRDRVALFLTSPMAGNNVVDKGMVYPRTPSSPPSTSSAAVRGPEGLGYIWSMAFVGTALSPVEPNTDDQQPSSSASSLVLAVLVHRMGGPGSEVHILSCDPTERIIYPRARYRAPPEPFGWPLITQLIPLQAVPGALILVRPGQLVLLEVSQASNPKAVSAITLPSKSSSCKDELLEPNNGGGQGDEGQAECSTKGSMEEDHVMEAASGDHGLGGPSNADDNRWELLHDAQNSMETKGIDLLAQAIEYTEQVERLGGEMPNSLVNGEARLQPLRGLAGLPVVAAWSWEPDTGGTHHVLLISTDEGAFHRVSIQKTASTETSHRPHLELGEKCYQGAPCSALLCLGSGQVAALVELGDGHFLQAQHDGQLLSRSRIQNIAPVTDFQLADYDGEKQDQMLACCGQGAEGSVRVIRNGISVEQLLSSPPAFPGINATWPLRIRLCDPHHSLLVMSFLQETRVLSVGLSFNDITKTVGFDSGASTIACGRVEDDWLVQICAEEIRLCSPAIGPNASVPLVSSWRPPSLAEGGAIRVGTVAQGTILVALSRLGTLLMLGTEPQKHGMRRLVELQQCRLACELSCISIPQEEEAARGLALNARSPCKESAAGKPYSGEDTPSVRHLAGRDGVAAAAVGLEVGKFCLVGTYKPSVELLSLAPGDEFRHLAIASLMQSPGLSQGGVIPESVHLAKFDRLYVLVGLRNGMLLRFEWPSVLPPHHQLFSSRISSHSTQGWPTANQSPPRRPKLSTSAPMDCDQDTTQAEATLGGAKKEPVVLHLVAVRRIGASPVSLVPLKAALGSEVVALSDRPWLLQATYHRQRVAYTPISFQASSHATALSTSDCPLGLVFIADCRLHLVEMEHSKRLSVQRLPVGGTPRRLVYHSASKTLLIICIPEAAPGEPACCEIRCMDPMGGSTHAVHRLDPGEVAFSLQVWKPEAEELIVVGTGPADVPPLSVMNGDPVRYSKGKDPLPAFPILSSLSFWLCSYARWKCRAAVMSL